MFVNTLFSRIYLPRVLPLILPLIPSPLPESQYYYIPYSRDLSSLFEAEVGGIKAYLAVMWIRICILIDLLRKKDRPKPWKITLFVEFFV